MVCYNICGVTMRLGERHAKWGPTSLHEESRNLAGLCLSSKRDGIGPRASVMIIKYGAVLVCNKSLKAQHVQSLTPVGTCQSQLRAYELGKYCGE